MSAALRRATGASASALMPVARTATGAAGPAMVILSQGHAGDQKAQGGSQEKSTMHAKSLRR